MKSVSRSFGHVAGPFVFLLLLIISCSNIAMAGTSAGDPAVPRFGLFEVSFQCPDTTGNPFNPTANDVWATLIGPKGTVRIPAFWDGNGVWKARFCPENVGQYKVTLSRNGVDETANATSPVQFICIQSKSPGFIRVDLRNANYPHFVFDNGTVYFPLGMDAAWGGGNVLDYPDLFPKMTQYNMNFARVWTTDWDNKSLDWAGYKPSSPPLGVYLLDSARKWDSVFQAANASSVYVQMTLQYHGQVTTLVDPEWGSSPYNKQNPGGILSDPNQFFTDPTSIAYTKAKYRYIVARYAWSTHLLGFELFNEIQNDSNLTESDYIAWHNIMADYIRLIDPYHHLITTSYSDPAQKLAQQTSIDYYQGHAYPNFPSEFFRGQVQVKSPHPLFWGEFGDAGDQLRDRIHNGLWAGLMVPVAGAPEFWYWDTVQHNDWWQEFASAIDFVQQSGLSSAKDSDYVPATLTTDARAPLDLYPGLTWANEIGDGVVTVTPDGTATGLQNIPSTIQGNGHRDMMPNPLTLSTDFPNPVPLHVNVATISASGAHVSILIDGHPAGDLNLPGNGADTKVALTETCQIPAGQHSVQIVNTGNDWFVMDDVVLDGVASAADVMVRGIGNKYLFWINRVNGALPGPINSSLTINNVAARNYKVQLFDTESGTALGQPGSFTSTNGTLTVPLILQGPDIAGWIEPQR